MPADLLLPLFALVLLANAVLVAAAIRGMLRGRPDLDRPTTIGRPNGIGMVASRNLDRPLTDELKHAIAARQGIADEAPLASTPPGQAPLASTPPEPAAPDPEDPSDAGPDNERFSTSQASPARAAAGSSEAMPPATSPPATSPPETPAPRRRRTAQAGINADARGPRPADPPRRGRRRFSLPPEEDHEKVNRSIESFLSGIDGSGSDPAAGTADPSSGGPTTVALVAVDGLVDSGRAGLPTATGASTGNDVDDAQSADAVAMVERTLRGAARGSDVVSVDGRGRFRVILRGTGELAARAYLRRIRSTVEPMLEASDRPLRFVVATATVLGEPIEDAVRQADRRLAATLGATRDAEGATGQDHGEPAFDPRAAGD
ncbi:MAG TPA: hypothetical protein VHM48_15385 [Candidatus Limnocylindrales bacterium]|nr:hypothetical protein [Candidatus Limnocylindrales bacterium]